MNTFWIKSQKHNSLILLHNLQVFNNKNSKISKRQKNKMFNTHLINQLVVYYPTFTLLKKKTTTSANIWRLSST